jgi:hypothetical protein
VSRDQLASFAEKLCVMGFLDLFVAALMPVLKVLLITGLGLFLALDRIDLLGANARHYMNNVSPIYVYLHDSVLYIYFFLPSISSKRKFALCICSLYSICLVQRSWLASLERPLLSKV